MFVYVSEVSVKLPEDIPEACVSTDTDVEVDQSQSDHNDISLGNVSFAYSCNITALFAYFGKQL